MKKNRINHLLLNLKNMKEFSFNHKLNKIIFYL
jgi:hypothetical protein